MADLTCQVEHHGFTADQPLHGQYVAHVHRAHRQVGVVLDGVDDERIAAGLRDQAIDHGDRRAELEQPYRQVRADEAQAASHQDPLSLVELLHAADRGGVAAPETSRRGSSLSLIHRRLSSVSVRATLRKLKNWLSP